MRKTLLALTILSVACIHDPWRKDSSAQKAPAPQAAKARPAMDDNNPMLLLAAVFVQHSVASDPRSTPKERAKASKACYEIAYRQNIAGGMTRPGAHKIAMSLAYDAPMPTITCADYATKPPDCAAR